MAPSTDTSGKEFEVFLSFRGLDTRADFTSCLYHDMVEKGIRVFKDDKELKVGEKTEKILKALNDSQIYIPIFSKNFASSAWCLREVVRMVDCAKNSNEKEILPIFLDVKPEDVKSSTGLYSNALSLLKEKKAKYGDEEETLKYDPDEVKSWRDALREVPSRTGWKREGKEYGEFIKMIVQEVLFKLKAKNRYLPNNLVEMDDEKHIEELLKVDSVDDVRFVIIYGTGGIGKTTLASIIFNRFWSKFDYYSFLDDVQDSSQEHLLHKQKKLLTDTLGSTSAHGIQDTNEGIDRISRGLHNKKVLVVVDNVNKEEQLDKLVGSYKSFGRGSRIIVTLRDRRTIFNWTRLENDKQTQPSRYIEYPVKEMPVERAVQLFKKHAFRGDIPPKDLHNFSIQAVTLIGRLPLTLQVMGSLFAKLSKSKWDKTLKDLQQVSFKEVRDVLMISVNTLNAQQNQIFLDIACFCIGENETYASYMWDDCKFSPHITINDLLLMSLIKIDEHSNTFWMHDEVRDLGRYIANKENLEDAGNCRCLVIDENNLDILTRNKVKGDVRALKLAIPCNLKPDNIACLPKLRFLKGDKINFVGDFENCLHNLRWLSWQSCPLNFLAMNFHPVNLVVLDLSWSDVTHEWGGWRHIEKAKKLKVLNLSYCFSLTKTPNISEFGELEKLILKSCWDLHTIDSSIGKAKLLNTLDIEGCQSLQGLPKEIGSLECLSEIIMPYIMNPIQIQLPETLGDLKSLTKLTVRCNINQLPHSIGKLNLTHLVLSGCKNLQKLPNSIGELESLVELDLNSCSDLHELPNSIGKLESLVQLSLNCLKISILPNSIGTLKKLKHLLLLGCKNLCELPNSIGGLESLVNLNLSFSGISILPDSIKRLKKLEHLLLSKCNNLNELPDSIGDLESLVKLNLNSSRIFVLPNSIGRLKNLKYFLLDECMNLQNLPNSIGELESLDELYLDSCNGLHELPSSIGQLESLVLLSLKYLEISILPNSIGRLKKLKHLLLFGCKNLCELPNSIGDLESLVNLDLKFSGISILPDSIKRLKKLEHLLLSECNNLNELPNSVGELESLVELDLEFSRISVLPDSIGRLKNLKHLFLSKCKNLYELPDSIWELESSIKLDLKLSPCYIIRDSIGQLRNFTHLSFSECGNLLELVHFGEQESLVKLNFKLLEISTFLKSTRFTSLTHLFLSRCKNLYELPDYIGQLKILKVLNVAYTKIRTIPKALGGVETLEELDASFCPRLKDEIPWEMLNLTHLRILNLYRSPISIIPRNISDFSSLQTLKIASHWLSPLPELPSRLKCLVVEAAEFPILPDLSSLFHLHHLEVCKERSMTFRMPNEVTSPWKDVHSINRLPLSLSTLKLHTIPQLPDFSDFQSLLVLSITECLTPRMPNLLRLKRLQELRLRDFPELVEIPGLGELESLMVLHISMCNEIELLPNLLKLKNLRNLELKHCAKLRAVEGLKELNSLTKAEIEYCMSLEKLPDVPEFTELKTDCMAPEAEGHTIRSTVLGKRLQLWGLEDECALKENASSQKCRNF